MNSRQEGITPGEGTREGSRMPIILLRRINQDFGQTLGVLDKTPLFLAIKASFRVDSRQKINCLCPRGLLLMSKIVWH